MARTRLLTMVVPRHNELQPVISDCRQVKWCPCTLDDEVSAGDVDKLLVVTDTRIVSDLSQHIITGDLN